jgi:NADH dehydrogenase
MTRVVIIGAGFGGLECAKGLAGQPFDVLVLDKHNYHLFTPLLYQVASSLLDPSEIAYPIRAIFRRIPNVRFRMAEVTEIDCTAQIVKAADGAAIPYDVVVIATGSATNYFGMHSIAQRAHKLKDIPKALELRNHVLRCFEAAAWEPDPAARQRWLTFVIVGGGPNGVEYAGALSELIRLVLVRDFPELDMKLVRIVLVEALGQVLPAFSPKLGEYAQQQLARRGIEVRLNTRVLDISGDAVRLSTGETLEAKTLIWAAGVKASQLATVPPLPRTRTGRIEVDQYLRAKGFENIGSVEILELGGVTVYTKTVTPNEEFLPAAPVYRGVYATGNSTGAALHLEVLQAHLHPAPTGGALLPQDQAGRHLPGAHRLA